jgi:hypothetical protein
MAADGKDAAAGQDFGRAARGQGQTEGVEVEGAGRRVQGALEVLAKRSSSE